MKHELARTNSGGDIRLLSNFALLLSVRVPVFPHGGGVRTARSLGEKARMAQKIRKKSYRRACKRAFRDGSASYRGGMRRRGHFITGTKQSGICYIRLTTASSCTPSTFWCIIDYSQA